jgi:Cys-tRNA synthase (O-phospho-L-seryl-tRNA:Cys-tRNA synthase)
MDPFRKKKARHALLEALEMADGYPLADSVLSSYLQDLVKPPIKDAEWKDLVANALNNELIVQVPNKLDPEIVQYTITERGQAVVRN